MARTEKPQVTPPCIAALRVAFEGTFSKSEIPSKEIRLPINKVCRAFDGIKAIAQILYANETEREAQGPTGEVLDIKTVYGLHEALVYLANGGEADACDLGLHLSGLAKGEA
jgi:hypothetical protein